MAELSDEAALIAKLRALPVERQEQVRAFVDFLVMQEAQRGEDAASSAESEARSRELRASLDAALRNGPPAPEETPEDDVQRKAHEELARRFPGEGA